MGTHSISDAESFVDRQDSSTGGDRSAPACPGRSPRPPVDGRRHHWTACIASSVVPSDNSTGPCLLSNRWNVDRLHWHGFPGTRPPVSTVVLWTPTAVASWVTAETQSADLHHDLLLAASNGEQIDLSGLVVEPVTADTCSFGCVAS